MNTTGRPIVHRKAFWATLGARMAGDCCAFELKEQKRRKRSPARGERQPIRLHKTSLAATEELPLPPQLSAHAQALPTGACSIPCLLLLNHALGNLSQPMGIHVALNFCTGRFTDTYKTDADTGFFRQLAVYCFRIRQKGSFYSL